MKSEWESLKYRHDGWAVARFASLPIDFLETALSLSSEELLQHKLFSKILRHSQPKLWQSLMTGGFHGSEEEKLNLLRSYALRMATLPVPRKLMAGYSAVKIDRKTNLQPLPTDDWIGKQIQEAGPRQVGFYFLNTSLYIKGRELRLKRRTEKNGALSDHAYFLPPESISFVEKLLSLNGVAFDVTRAQRLLKLSKSKTEALFEALISLDVILPAFARDYSVANECRLTEIPDSNLNPEWEFEVRHSADPTISNKFAEKVAKATCDLLQLYQCETFWQFSHSAIAEFKRVGVQTLYDKDAPLIEAIDRLGLNLATSQTTRNRPPRSEAIFEFRKRILTETMNGAKVVRFNRNEIDRLIQIAKREFLTTEAPPMFPNSVAAFASIGPGETPVLHRVQSTHFLSAVGRYSAYDKLIRSHCQETLARLDQNLPNATTFAIIDWREPQSLDHTAVLNCADLQLPRICVNRPCVNALDIPLSDLYLRFTSNGPILRSRKLKKQILPVCASLLATGQVQDLTFDFLNGIAHSRLKFTYAASPVSVSETGFVPRIEFPSAIVSAAGWELDTATCKTLAQLNLCELEKAWVQRGLPRQVSFGSYETRSSLNIDFPGHINQIQSLLAGARKPLLLEELCNDPMPGAASRRTFDVVLPLVKSIPTIPINEWSTWELNDAQNSPQHLQLGGGVAAFEIYLPRSLQHRFLSDDLAPKLIEFEMKFKGLEFFFIRYTLAPDGFHFRVRLCSSKRKQLESAMLDFTHWLEKLIKKNTIEKYKLVPFSPEYYRFDGPSGLKVFFKESHRQSRFVAALASMGELRTADARLEAATKAVECYLNELIPDEIDRRKLICEFSEGGSSAGKINGQHNSRISNKSLLPIRPDIRLLQKDLKSLHLSKAELIKWVLKCLHLLINRAGIAEDQPAGDQVVYQQVKQRLFASSKRYLALLLYQ